MAGNSAYDLVTVFVEDPLPPVLETQNITINLDETGSAMISAEDLISSVNDNCSVAETALDQYFFHETDIGNVTVDVTATDAQGNAATEQAIVTVQSDFIGIGDFTNLDINVYPNPAKNTLNIIFPDRSEQRTALIISASGKTVYTGTPTRENIAIEISNFAAGMYILQIKTNQAVYNAKIFKE